MSLRFIIEKLAAAHDRNAFECGNAALDRYLQQFARQDSQRGIANCFVAVPQDSSPAIAGFYTLSATAIPLPDLPDGALKRLPRYGNVPAVLIGRLAVDTRYRGMRLGEAMLLDAAERVLVSAPAAFALVVDAKDAEAASFYRRYGFEWLRQREVGGSLFVPIASLDAHRRKETP